MECHLRICCSIFYSDKSISIKNNKKEKGKLPPWIYAVWEIHRDKPLILQIKGENKQTWINTSVSTQVKSQIISTGLKSVTTDCVLVSSRS